MIQTLPCKPVAFALTLLIALFAGFFNAIALADSKSFKVVDVSERAYNGGTAIAIQFSAAVDRAQNIDDFLHLNLVSGKAVDGAWVLSDNARSAWFSHIEPATEYRVQVDRGLLSSQGVAFSQHHEQTLTTRSITPGAEFKGNGHFMPAGLAKGLIVSSINVPEVNIDFFHVEQAQVSAFLQSLYYRSGGLWSRYTIDNVSQHARLVFSGRYQLGGERNQHGDSSIPLQAVPELQSPGLYMAVMTLPGEYSNSRPVSYFSVTDIGLHARFHGDKMEIFTSSLASGKALDQVELKVLDDKGQILHQGFSDNRGFARVRNLSAKARYLFAQQGNHLTYLPLQGPALDLSSFDLGSREQRNEEIFIYSPRDLFRPGESVDFNALRRDADGRLLDDIPLRVNILRPDRVSAKSLVWHPQQRGYYHFRFDIPPSAPTGNWTLQVSGIEKKPVEYRFKVEEFLPERMEFDFNHGQTERLYVGAQQALQIPISGRYLYGAPAAGNRFGAFVTVTHSDDLIESLPGFRFGHSIDDSIANFESAEIKLDDDGQGVLQIDPVWSGDNAALAVKVVGNLYESGGRAVSRVYRGYVWPRQAMLGIKPDFAKKEADANANARFQVVKSTQQGHLLAAENLEVTLIREDRNYFWEYDSNSGWDWRWTDKEYPVYSELLSLAGSTPTTLQVPIEEGRYRLEIMDRDNNQQLTSISFRAGEDWYRWWQDNQDGRAAARPDQVNIAFDQKSYNNGDVAKMQVVPPHAGQAIITVEADRLLWFERTWIPAEGATIEIPIADHWRRHDLYVSAVVFKAGAAAEQHITPNRAVGLRHLPLDRSARELTVDILSDDNIRPNQTRRVQLRVNQSGEKPSGITQLTLAAVDAGALAVSDFQTPDPVSGFFGQRRYSVDQRDIYADIMQLDDASPASLRFGGDAALARGGKAAKADVQIVSLFSGPVSTNAAGLAEVDLNIPEFEGRLRLMALAFDDERFGSAERDITVASPVIAQLAMPRFLAFGDRAIVTLDVTNMSGEARDISVFLDTTQPLTLAENTQHDFHLAHGARKTIAFVVGADAMTGTGKIRARLSSDGMEDVQREWSLAVRSAYPATTQTVAKVLTAGEQLDVGSSVNFADYQADSLQALVSISNLPQLGLRDQLKNLIGYPYGCLEQTTSKSLPLAYASADSLQQVGLEAKSSDEIQQLIDRGLQRLASLQQHSGGFGLWDSQSSEEQWLTAFAADFLLSARDNGFRIDDAMLDKALDRLKTYLQQHSAFIQQRYSDAPKHYAFATKAYAAYLLASQNRVTLSSLRTLYDREAKHAKSPLPILQLGLALKTQGDHKRADAAIKQALSLALALPISGRDGYFGDYGSVIRDMAAIIHLLGKHDLNASSQLALGHFLARELHHQQWLSTQERGALFLAGLALNKLPASAWQAEIDSASTQMMQGSGNLDRLLEGNELGDHLLIKALEGKGLYSSVSVSGYLKAMPPPSDNGLTITRHYLNLQGQAIDLSQVQSGDLVLVDSVIGASQKTPDALLVDLLPAGFELENQNLNHSASLTDLKIDGQAIATLQQQTRIAYQEFRDDRFIAALDLDSHAQAHVIYLMRAVTPGEFSVPPVFVEDMYRPEFRALSESLGKVVISSPN